jgi:hypothetical protein
MPHGPTPTPLIADIIEANLVEAIERDHFAMNAAHRFDTIASQ